MHETWGTPVTYSQGLTSLTTYDLLESVKKLYNYTNSSVMVKYTKYKIMFLNPEY